MVSDFPLNQSIEKCQESWIILSHAMFSLIESWESWIDGKLVGFLGKNGAIGNNCELLQLGILSPLGKSSIILGLLD